VLGQSGKKEKEGAWKEAKGTKIEREGKRNAITKKNGIDSHWKIKEKEN